MKTLRLKRFTALLAAVVMVFGLLAGCGSGTSSSNSEGANTGDAGGNASSSGNAASGESGKTIKIGLMTALSGSSASLGIDGRDGLKLYLEQNDYTFGGHKVELFVEDDEALAGTTVTKAKKLVEMDDVDLLIGPFGLGGLYAVADYVSDMEIPLVVAGAVGDDITQRIRNDYVIRIGSSSSQSQHALGEYAAVDMGLKRAVCLSNDFAFGYECVSGFQRVFEDNGGVVVDKIFVPNDTADFSPYLSNLNLDDIDCFYYQLSGTLASRCAAQLKEYGIIGKVAILGGGNSTDESMIDQLDESAVGIVSAREYSAAIETEENQTFKAAFQQAYGRSASLAAEQYYTCMRMVGDVIASMDSFDTAAFMKAIRTAKVDDAPRGPVTIDEYGQFVGNIYIREVEMVDGKLQNTVIKTYENCSQFWTYDPAAYMAEPVYDKDNPPLKK